MSKRYIPAIIITLFFLLGGLVMVSTLDSQGADPAPEFVGQQTCMNSDCHPATDRFGGHVNYQQTMHARIHERPTTENVIIDRWFEQDTVLWFRESRISDPTRDTFFIGLSKLGSESDYFIRLFTVGEYADTTEWFPVAYNYGGQGWLQRFLLKVGDSYYPAPFQYVLGSYRDHETDTGKVFFLDVARWASVDQQKNAFVFHDRTTEKFYKESWDKRCAACHVNGYNYRVETEPDGDRKWIGEWPGTIEGDSAAIDVNIAIGCESCHGPGSAHVADPTDQQAILALSPKRWDPTNSSRYWTDRKLDLCNQCHNRHTSTAGAHGFPYDEEAGQVYQPGLTLNSFIADSVKGGSYWADAATSYAHHQTGQDYWRSAHYDQHVFPNGCYDCHAVSWNTEYPYQLRENYYSLNAGEGCLEFGCHAEKSTFSIVEGEEVNDHSKHLQEHSQCVNCHYTKTATIAFTGTLEFSDHSGRVIRPTETKKYAENSALGMMNTCASECHRNGYGERNRPDAFDRNASIRYSTGVTPMKAPDFGIHDSYYSIWREKSDLDLADSLWEGYKRMYAEYLDSSEIIIENPITGSKFVSVSPNPTEGPVQVVFELDSDQKVVIEVFDAVGRRVRNLSRMNEFRGARARQWDLRDDEGRLVPKGIYYVRVVGETFEAIRGVFVYGGK